MGSWAYTLPNREQQIREASMAFTLPERDRRIRKGRYNASFHQPFRVDTGTTYPCTSRELALLTDKCLLPTAAFPTLTVEKAVSDLEDALGPYFTTSTDAVAALRCFRDKGKNPRQWGPDLIFKAFADLDRAFFGGQLQGRVLLRWEGEMFFLKRSGPASALGLSDCKEFYGEAGKVWVYLNVDWLLLYKGAELRHVWDVVLHEMIHVYLVYRTDDQSSEPGHINRSGKPDPYHGPYFERCRRAVRSRFPGRLHHPPVS